MAYRAKGAGSRREVDLPRGSVRLTDEAFAELRDHIAQLAGRFQDPKARGEGVWTSVIFALVDLQDRPPAARWTGSALAPLHDHRPTRSRATNAPRRGPALSASPSQ